jgi:hypothetical protein
MTSLATEIATICREGLDALESGREIHEDLLARLEAVGRPDRAGSPEEIREALRATRALQDAVAAAQRETALELTRVRSGRRALGGYHSGTTEDPRAVDLSA